MHDNAYFRKEQILTVKQFTTIFLGAYRVIFIFTDQLT